jgi:hypothetical protein
MPQQYTVLALGTPERRMSARHSLRCIVVAAMFCLMGTHAFAQGVAINTTSAPADPSAMLDVNSLSKGMLIPRMTKAQRMAIPLPAKGLIVYQTDGMAGLYINVQIGSPGWVVLAAADSLGNTASGFAPLESISGSITGGGANVAIGFQALRPCTICSGNIAIGPGAMKAETEGASNIGIGEDVLRSDYSGWGNVGIGLYALESNISGTRNTAVGAYALSYNNGSHNTAIGCGADVTDSLTGVTVIGYGARVSASNTMVFGDGNVLRWGFGVNAASGHAVEVGTNSTNGNGAYLTSGGTWTNASDRNKKENFTPVDGEELLTKIDQLPITMWNYKGESKEIRHIGPVAQDFSRIFNVGNDDKSISTIDPSGIALAAIKELNHALSALRAENAHLKDRLSRIEHAMDHQMVSASADRSIVKK